MESPFKGIAPMFPPGHKPKAQKSPDPTPKGQDPENSTTKTIATIENFISFLGKIKYDDSGKERLHRKFKELQAKVEIVISKLSDTTDNKLSSWIASSVPSLVDGGEDGLNVDDWCGSSVHSGPGMLFSPLERVNCQFCEELMPDLQALAGHVTTNMCPNIKYENFSEKKYREYSIFQLLSNNRIKCGLCQSFLSKFEDVISHTFSNTHLENSEIQKKKKTAGKTNQSETSFIYCVACKENVPDNKIQYEQHVNNKVHLARADARGNFHSAKLMKEGVLYLWRPENHCRCLVCNEEFEFSEKQREIHSNGVQHVARLVQGSDALAESRVVCAVCGVTTDVWQLVNHLRSPGHGVKAKEQSKPPREKFCVFCNAMWPGLQALADHQRSGCRLVQDLTTVEKMAVEPSPEAKFQCSSCRFDATTEAEWTAHLVTPRHISLVARIAKFGSPVVSRECPECGLTILCEDICYGLHVQSHSSARPEKKRPRKAKSPAPKQSSKITVVGFPDASRRLDELQNYFQVFGELQKMQIEGNGSVTVKFSASGPAQQVLNLRDSHVIGGVTVTVSEYKKRNNTLADNTMLLQPAVPSTSKANSFIEMLKDIDLSGGMHKSMQIALDAFDPLSDKSLLSPSPKQRPVPRSPDCPPTEFDRKHFSSKSAVMGLLETEGRSNLNPSGLSQVVDACCQTLRGKKYEIIGSHAHSTAVSGSSFDIMVNYPLFEGSDSLDKREHEVLAHVLKLVLASPAFGDVARFEACPVPRVAALVLPDIPCHVTFGPHHAADKTRLIRQWVEADGRVGPLVRLLKLWAKDKGLLGPAAFSGYALTMVVMHFLQGDTIRILQRKQFPNTLLSHVDFTKDMFGERQAEPHDVVTLFFKLMFFCATFNYSESIMCLPLGSSVPRATLLTTEVLREAFSADDIGVMDPFEPNKNITSSVTKSQLQKFVRHAYAMVDLNENKFML